MGSRRPPTRRTIPLHPNHPHPAGPWTIPLAVVGLLALLLLSSLSFSGVAGAEKVAAPRSSLAGAGSTVPGAALLADARASIAAGHGPAQGSRAAPIGPLSSTTTLSTGTALTYDAADGYVLAVGANVTGNSSSPGWGLLAQYWTFSGGNWTQRFLSYGPSNRNFAALTYDPTDGYALLYGGVALGGTSGFQSLLADTWSYHAGNWTNRSSGSTASPGPRAYADIAWDASDGYALLVGGMGINGNATGNASTTWEFAHGNWSGGPLAPPLGASGAMAYDAADGYIVYFGGSIAPYPYFPITVYMNATWTFHAGNWTNRSGSIITAPSPRVSSALSYDPNLGALLLFGGYGYLSNGSLGYLNDTWSYAHLNWTLLSAASGPAPREGAQMTFDAADNVTVLFGGVNYTSGTAYGDTWAFNPSGIGSAYAPLGISDSLPWAQAAPKVALTAPVVDVGGALEIATWGAQGTSITYQYLALPPGCADFGAASGSCVPSAAGTYPVSVLVTSSAGSARADATVTVVPDPAVTEFSVSPALTEVGGTLRFNATTADGVAPYSYNYLGLPAGCASASSLTLSCVAAAPGPLTVTFEVTDRWGFFAQQSVTAQVRATPDVTSLTLAPAAIDLGQSVAITSGISGGVAPYTFSYGGLPAGCTTTSELSFRCTPTSSGNFPIGVVVTDGLGFQGQGAAGLTVNTDPSITSFSADQPNLTLGGTVTLTVAATGGTGPLQYLYETLPAGCVGANASTLTCTPTSTGTFNVTVAISDVMGYQASATVQIVIAMAPIGPPNPGGSSHSGSGHGSSSPNNAAALFYTGLGIGLVALAAAGAVLAYRSRLAREGAQLVRDLRSAPADDVTSSAGVPGPPSR